MTPADAQRSVYALVHEYAHDGAREAKDIGVFATLEDATEAIERLQTQPGFVDHPEGFQILRFAIDRGDYGEVIAPGTLAPDADTAAPLPASLHSVQLSKNGEDGDDWAHVGFFASEAAARACEALVRETSPASAYIHVGPCRLGWVGWSEGFISSADAVEAEPDSK